jgi:hypothetical protein
MDLPLGELTIGRGATCGLTIDDPLVSRTHARIVIDETGGYIEDAGSRNGIRVDGRIITGRTKIADGARFRVGTQELMFREMEDAAAVLPRRRSTGFMIHCSSCGLPCETTSTECPSCGKVQGEDDEPTTTTEQAWSIELLAETLHRAQVLNRKQDVERLLIQARGVLETTSLTIDRRRLDQLADGAIRFASNQGNPDWARWALGLYSKRGIAPGAGVGVQLNSLPPQTRETLAPAVQAVVKSLRPTGAGEQQEDEEALKLLRQLSHQSETG